MITVYVIESLLDQTWYTGMSKDVDVRLHEHNLGKNRFTKRHRPWKIIYMATVLTCGGLQDINFDN